MHKAVITTIRDFQPIPGADRIQTARVFNGAVDIATVVIGKEHEPGELGIYFAPDLQLSEEYARVNDLVAVYDEHGEKIGGGYFNDKRRVTAQRFRGVRSEGLWMPIASLAYTGAEGFQLGMQLDAANEHELCTKYYTPQTARVRSARGTGRDRVTLDDRVIDFPRHADTEQLAYFVHTIPVGARVIITEKEHGTSHRVGHVRTRVRLNPLQRAANVVLRPFIKREYFPSERYAIVHGSRNRVVGIGDHGYHGPELFRFAAATPSGELPRDVVLYGEITGYANNRPIMPPHDTKAFPELRKRFGDKITYAYGNLPDQATFHVYHATGQLDGQLYHFPWQSVRELAQQCGFTPVEELDSFVYDGNAEALLARVKGFAENVEPGYADSSWDLHPGEGVVLRVEHNGAVTHYKYKSFVFKVLEGIIKADDSYVDTEEAA